MIVIIPNANQVMSLFRSPYLAAKRISVDRYNLTGESFQMADISPGQIVILPDNVDIESGGTLTGELMARELPLESFVSVCAEDASSEVIQLLLRAAVADGKITDEELLRVQPAIGNRLWQPNIAVQIGDVYSFGGCLWRCIQAHTTQGDWSPDLTPALWHKVEIALTSVPRIWDTAVEYAVDDTVWYPDAQGTEYKCLQAHTSQAGWEPPNVPALWAPIQAK